MKRLSTTTERITNRNNKAFNYYLTEIQGYEPLDVDEEYELSEKMVSGDEAAKDKLIKHNLRFVISVAKQYYGTNVGLEDLVNEGNIGLLMAADRFDPTKGFKFISYAVWWIRKSIIEFLSNKGDAVRIPVNRSYIMGKVKDRYNSLEQELGRTPNEIDLLNDKETDFNYGDIILYFSYYHGSDEYLDDYIGGDGDSKTTRGDQLKDDSIPETDSLLNESDSDYRVTKYLAILKPNQKEVMMRIFGLFGSESTSMESISYEMGISKERVRQLREESLEILRVKLKFSDL